MMPGMKPIYAAVLLALFVGGCASPGVDQGAPIGYTWQGQPGAAAVRFGSLEAAQAAMSADAAACDWEVHKAEAARPMHPAQASLAGAVLFASAAQDKAEGLHRSCMAARGWTVYYGGR
jgi:hypothetical protein